MFRSALYKLRWGLAFLSLTSGAAFADYIIRDGNGTLQTALAFVCSSTKVCPGHVLISSAGTEIATSGAPLRIDPTGTTTQPVRATNEYPNTATPYTASATGTTGATTATLTGASSVTTYICGFSIRANATAAATGNATVTGTITGTLNFTQWTAPLASGLGITEMIFTPCVPASATNTSVAVISAAPGSGGVVSVTAWGYKL